MIKDDLIAFEKSASRSLSNSIDADIIDDIIKAGKILDEQDVPKTNRKIWPEK